MVKPTLLVLAAGMGSRYGSLKQMDGVGPNGEAIIDYSIYDAVRAGFGRVVFVIRHLFEKEFREIFTPERFGGRIAVDFVFQELDKLPAGFTVPADRVKPWGTNHAVMMGAEAIGDEPFAVINADDFYGDDAYRTMADYLRSVAGQKTITAWWAMRFGIPSPSTVPFRAACAAWTATATSLRWWNGPASNAGKTVASPTRTSAGNGCRWPTIRPCR